VLGIPLKKIPDLLPSQPSRARPVSAVKNSALVACIPASAKESDSGLFKSRLVANLYRALGKSQRQLVAAQVDYLNDYLYRTTAHSLLLGVSSELSLWKSYYAI